MERLLLAQPLPTDNFGQQHSSSSSSGSSLVEFLTNRSIDLNGDVIGGLPVAAQTVGVGANLNDEDDVVLGHHGPSYYDQNLASASALHQSIDLVTMQHDDDALVNGAEYAWMKDKKVTRKNNREF